MKYGELLKLRKEGKLSNKQGKCPYCNETLDNYGAIEFEGDMAYFPWHCDKCGTDGEEWYSMYFNGHNIYDEKGEQIEV